MGQLTITLSDELEKQIRDYVVKKNFSSVSDFARETLSRATLGVPTYWERTYLVHLMEIKKLQGVDIDDTLLDALKNGYAKFYAREEYGVTRDEMSDEDMEFVMQILEMYAHLQYSYRELGIKELVIEKKILFPGFDGNSSDGHLGFLHFLVKNNKYTYVQPLDKGHAINSHRRMTETYQRMLDEYKSIKQNPYEHRPLSHEELKRVINAPFKSRDN